MSQGVLFSLVIACYKDAPHLRRNTLALCDYFSQTKMSYEIIFIDDGSPDHTAEEIRSTASELKRRGIPYKEIFFSQNQGRGAAVSRGIVEASGDIVGYIDIDLEPLMDAFLPVIEKVRDGTADVVVGRRVIANAIAKPIRVLSSYVYRWLAHMALPLPVADTECGFKVFDRNKITPVIHECQDKRWFWDTEVVHRAWTSGLKVAEHWIVFYEDTTKASTVRLIPDTWAYLKAIRKYRSLLSQSNKLLPKANH